MMDDLIELEQLAGTLVRALDAGQRRALFRRMARSLGNSQRQRIAAQRDPAGAAFAARAKRAAPQVGKYAVSFLYPSGGTNRKVVLKSYTKEHGMMTGFDLEAGGIRSFLYDKVVKWLPVPDEHQNASGGRLRRRGSVRRKAMFRKLATRKFLREGTDDLGFWVGFTGRASQVASIHQYGLRDRPSLKARLMKYEQRELLGTTDADRMQLVEIAHDYFAEVMR